MTRDACDGCVFILDHGKDCDGGHEWECRDEGFKAWKPRTVFKDVSEAARYHDAYMQGMSFHAKQMGNVYMVKWGDA